MFYAISLASLCFLGLLIGFLIFQQFYSNYYYTSISILIITVSYGTAAIFILFLSWTFFSWYQSNRNLIVFLYSISMLGIAFNLLVSATYVGIKLNDLPARIGEYVGSSGDASGGRYPILTDIYKVSSIVSFISIWVTTAIMMYTYRDKLIATIAYWLILSVPLIYFLIAYSFQFTLGGILRPFMENDPVTISTNRNVSVFK